MHVYKKVTRCSLFSKDMVKTHCIYFVTHSYSKQLKTYRNLSGKCLLLIKKLLILVFNQKM